MPAPSPAAVRLRCALYALIALAALVGTASQLGRYLPLGPVQGNLQFWQDTLGNAASRFITVDIFFVFLVVWHWMLRESRRLGMGGIAWYFVASLLVAFSTALPLFMLHRELALQRRGAGPEVRTDVHADAPLGTWGWLSLLAVAAGTIAYTWRSLLAT